MALKLEFFHTSVLTLVYKGPHCAPLTSLWKAHISTASVSDGLYSLLWWRQVDTVEGEAQTKHSRDCWACPAVSTSMVLCLESLCSIQLLISRKCMRTKTAEKLTVLCQLLLMLTSGWKPALQWEEDKQGRFAARPWFPHALGKAQLSCSSTPDRTHCSNQICQAGEGLLGSFTTV